MSHESADAIIYFYPDSNPCDLACSVFNSGILFEYLKFEPFRTANLSAP